LTAYDTHSYTRKSKGGVGKPPLPSIWSLPGALRPARAVEDLDRRQTPLSSLGIDKYTVKKALTKYSWGRNPLPPDPFQSQASKSIFAQRHLRLAGAEVELIDLPKPRGTALREAILSRSSDATITFLWMPTPSLLKLAYCWNGLMAARDGVFIPVQCEYLALEGIGQLTQT